ncbi:cyclase family protein [Aneurinibacillus sp. UBA3580]|jgi:kynurenine formamidase|uniref:cyclase family protein n=1 Tax=Aneurinibacillus sp. UBA3580 TaxID=1946041 RepID=UPI00257E98FF|nr:cyclase family protein [Aneurinibacillus sp. UBA3580]
MTRLVDLTMPWGPEVQPLKGHPSITFTPITTHEVEKRSNTEVLFSIHTGTHIDSPYHFFSDGKTIEQIPLDVFIGPALLVDVREVAKPNHEITLDELKTAGGLTEELVQGKRLVLWGDWASKHWNSKELYENNPYLSQEAAMWLRDAGVVAVGLDFAVDGAPPYPNHPILLGSEIPLIENLVNLEAIHAREFTLIALPLPVVGGDGSPARVVAQIDD